MIFFYFRRLIPLCALLPVYRENEVYSPPYEPVDQPNFFRSNASPNLNRNHAPADLPNFFNDPNFLGDDSPTPQRFYFGASPNSKRNRKLGSEARHVFSPEKLISPETGAMDPLVEADSDTEDDPTKLLNQWLGELNTLKKVNT